MDFPDTNHFLEMFGLEPVEEDASTAFCRYVKRSDDKLHELEISFSAVEESFQVILRYGLKELITVSSESVRLIELRNDSGGAGLHIVFDVRGITSEAIVNLEPELSCHWWTLKTEQK